jgi:CDP-2,3-bis-(O-geranylgeranyl)-sn-glycerol synthase
MSLVNFVLMCLYLMIPGAVANMIPLLVRRVPFLDYPIDFNIKIKDKPLFGRNKTFRGFFFGVLGAIIVAYIMKLLYVYPFIQSISFIDFTQVHWVYFGFMIGMGVLVGDAVESAVKRRLNINPGEPFFPWDQLDLLIGGVIFLSIIKLPTWQMLVFYFVAVPLVHIGLRHLAYYLKITKEKW